MPYELYFGPTDKEFYFEIQGAVKHVLARCSCPILRGRLCRRWQAGG